MDWHGVFQQALSYQDFLQQYGSDSDRQLWAGMRGQIELSEPQQHLLATWSRQMKVLCMAGAWCGDCVQQCPIFDRFAEACPRIQLRLVDRDAGPWREELTICGGSRVPQVVFLSEDDLPVGRYGDRTLAKYRQLGQQQLGASCPTGIGSPPAELTAAVVQDWLDEFERIQWILRLSPRLRERHGD